MACCAVLLYKRRRDIMRGEGRSCHHIHYDNGGTNCTSSISINRVRRSWLLLLVKKRLRLPLGMKGIRVHQNCGTLKFVSRLFTCCTNWNNMYLKLCFFKQTFRFLGATADSASRRSRCVGWCKRARTARKEARKEEQHSGRQHLATSCLALWQCEPQETMKGFVNHRFAVPDVFCT